MDGWIKLHRKIQYSAIWQDDEPFDRRSAWIDLLMMANHSERKILFDGKIVTVERGQFLTSILKLSQRWKWDRKKVSKFLNLLETDEMVTTKRTTHGTTITIVNYEKFQFQGTTDGTTDGTTTTPTMGQRLPQPLPINKNKKNINNYKNEEDSSTSKLKKLEQYYLSGGN